MNGKNGKGEEKMEFMGTKEAAEKLGVKQATVSAWCREGRIPNAEQDAYGSPWRIPASFTKKDLLSKNKKKGNVK